MGTYQFSDDDRDFLTHMEKSALFNVSTIINVIMVLVYKAKNYTFFPLYARHMFGTRSQVADVNPKFFTFFFSQSVT